MGTISIIQEDSVIKNSSMANSDDLDFILGENHQYTWDEFYNTLEHERANGNPKCPQASYIALELMKPVLMQLPWRNYKTDSETHKDFINNAYLTITDHIAEFDPEHPSQAAFKTFIMKWLQGLARETRDGEISDYQKKKFGFKVLSTDAMIAKNSTFDGENAEAVIEFLDEASCVEDIVEQKDNVRSGQLFRQMIGTYDDPQTEEERQKIYTNAACYHLFLGGITNLSEEMREEMERLAAER